MRYKSNGVLMSNPREYPYAGHIPYKVLNKS